MNHPVTSQSWVQTQVVWLSEVEALVLVRVRTLPPPCCRAPALLGVGSVACAPILGGRPCIPHPWPEAGQGQAVRGSEAPRKLVPLA